MTKEDEGDFRSVFQSYRDGYVSISEVVEHVKFQERLKRLARMYDFRVFRGGRGIDDLCQDILLKLLEEEFYGKLQIPGNVQTEEDFFIWLFFVVRHHHFSAIRKQLALKRDGRRSDKPVEEYHLPVWDGDHDREEVLSLFPEFIKRYPVKRQLVIQLWLENKPYRMIAEMILKHLGVKISHATARNWVNATIKAFKESLESPTRPQRTPSHRRTGA